MDMKYTHVSRCPERKSIVALRMFKRNLAYLTYSSQITKGSMAPLQFPASFEAILLGSENQEAR